MGTPNWSRIEKLMRNSVRGGQLSEAEHRECVMAWEADQPKYRVLSEQVRTEEQNKINPLIGSDDT